MEPRRAYRQLKELQKHIPSIRLAAEEWDAPWKTLIATLLSARTRDEKTIVIAERLFENYDTLGKIAGASLREVQALIREINFYKTKAKNLIACARRLINEHKGVVPLEIEELLELPGVGRKTANVFLAEMGRDAIGVDTHVAYISRALGWTNEDDPKKIEIDLTGLFPKKSWSNINSTLVRFGKKYTSFKEKDAILDEIRRI